MVPPKSSIFIGFSIIFTIHFGGLPPIFGNTHIGVFSFKNQHHGVTTPVTTQVLLDRCLWASRFYSALRRVVMKNGKTHNRVETVRRYYFWILWFIIWYIYIYTIIRTSVYIYILVFFLLTTLAWLIPSFLLRELWLQFCLTGCEAKTILDRFALQVFWFHSSRCGRNNGNSCCGCSTWRLLFFSESEHAVEFLFRSFSDFLTFFCLCSAFCF